MQEKVSRAYIGIAELSYQGKQKVCREVSFECHKARHNKPAYLRVSRLAEETFEHLTRQRKGFGELLLMLLETARMQAGATRKISLVDDTIFDNTGIRESISADFSLGVCIWRCPTNKSCLRMG